MKGVPHEARAGRPVRQAGGRAGSEGGKADRTEHRYGDGGGDGDRGYRRLAPLYLLLLLLLLLLVAMAIAVIVVIKARRLR